MWESKLAFVNILFVVLFDWPAGSFHCDSRCKFRWLMWFITHAICFNSPLFPGSKSRQTWLIDTPVDAQSSAYFVVLRLSKVDCRGAAFVWNKSFWLESRGTVAGGKLWTPKLKSGKMFHRISKTKPGFRGILLVMMLGFYRLCLTLSRALLYSKNCKQKVVESFFRFSHLFVLMHFAF